MGGHVFNNFITLANEFDLLYSRRRHDDTADSGQGYLGPGGRLKMLYNVFTVNIFKKS